MRCLFTPFSVARRVIAGGSAALIAVLLLTSCEQLPLPPIPPKPALATPPRSFSTKNGKAHTIIVTLPTDNPAAQRYPNDYIHSYILGYMNAWNSEVLDRRLKYRAYDGAFASATARENFALYEGEEFDVETWKLQLASNAASPTTPFGLSDQTTAKSTGRTDGIKAAKEAFARQMRPQEKS
jgi:hypothetical protein